MKRIKEVYNTYEDGLNESHHPTTALGVQKKMWLEFQRLLMFKRKAAEAFNAGELVDNFIIFAWGAGATKDHIQGNFRSHFNDAASSFRDVDPKMLWRAIKMAKGGFGPDDALALVFAGDD